MKRHRLLGFALPLALIGVLLLSLLVGGASGGSSNHRYQWDIIHLSTLPPPTTTLPGGMASACAAPSCANMITLTGSGTFRSNPGHPQDVTGGGTWTAVGAGAGSGTYQVTGFVSFALDASGFLPSPPFTDGVTGVTGILQVTLWRDASWLAGELVPITIAGDGIPRPDPAEAAHGLVRTLSRKDFGRRAMSVSRLGVLRPPR
jgi:hypothetical protein